MPRGAGPSRGEPGEQSENAIKPFGGFRVTWLVEGEVSGGTDNAARAPARAVRAVEGGDGVGMGQVGGGGWWAAHGGL